MAIIPQKIQKTVKWQKDGWQKNIFTA